MKQKVLAYLIRKDKGKQQLLVFIHRDYPEAGIQVPGGTVEEGEQLEIALLRELEEEAGLEQEQLSVRNKVTETIFYNSYTKEYQNRHIFLVQASTELPEQWSHFVTGDGDDRGLCYLFFWIDVTSPPNLIADQGKYLQLLH